MINVFKTDCILLYFSKEEEIMEYFNNIINELIKNKDKNVLPYQIIID
jgi:hypothetical protein